MFSKQSIAYFLMTVAAASAALPPGYEDEMWCPKGTCDQYQTMPPGFTGPQSTFHKCYDPQTGKVTDAIWTGSKSDTVAPKNYIENPSPCKGDLASSAPYTMAPTDELTSDVTSDVTSSSTTSNVAMPGSDRDKHGCIPSAGYSWCESLQECVQPWETPCESLSSSAPSTTPSSAPSTASSSTDCQAGTVWCPETSDCVDVVTGTCPVKGGQTFTGPAKFECNGSGRCDASKCAAMQNGGVYLTGLAGNQDIPDGCELTCDVNCSDKVIQQERLSESSSSSSLRTTSMEAAVAAAAGFAGFVALLAL